MEDNRKTKIVTISRDNRDKGRTYYIKEKPASQTEKWAARCFLALNRAGIDIGDFQGQGMAAIFVLGLKMFGSMRFEDAEILLDEMFTCIQIMPNMDNPNIIRPLVENDIEEVSTRLHLREEVFELHAGFSLAGLSQKLI